MRSALIVIVVAGCASKSSPTTSADAPGADTPAACTFLEGKTFTTPDQHECGLGPSGPTQCPWHVTFTSDGAAASAFTWGHSDVEESGTVACVGMSITVMSQTSPSLVATFDAATHTLHWDGLAYVAP